MVNVPIMSADDEKFMAHVGLIQWTHAVVNQTERVLQSIQVMRNFKPGDVHPTYAISCEQHYFVIAAYKVIEYRDWIKKFGLFTSVNFTEIDSFSWMDLKDLRNMREHVVEYYQGDGRTKNRWVVQTPDFSADASSSVGTMIGGRLDYEKFSAAAGRLLPQLQAEPIPYPALGAV